MEQQSKAKQQTANPFSAPGSVEGEPAYQPCHKRGIAAMQRSEITAIYYVFDPACVGQSGHFMQSKHARTWQLKTAKKN